jgi:hypothetical protein
MSYMAKLIYEDDQGRQTSFEITQETLTDMQNIYGVSAWDEVLKAFKTVIEETQYKEIE